MSIPFPLPLPAAARPRRAPWRTARDLDLQQSLDVELLLSTHLSIVVHARVEFDETEGSHETGLVIARERCRGDRPSGQALLDAARRCVGHLSYGAPDTPRPAPPRPRPAACWRASTVTGCPCSTAAGAAPATGREGPPFIPWRFLMNTRHTAVLLAALVAGSAAPAHTPGAISTRADAEANYRKERADCMAGRSAQDRATCLKEAGAARAEARRGTLGSNDARELAQNALLRCQRVPASDREDCERLAVGLGERDGSGAPGAGGKQITTLQFDAP